MEVLETGIGDSWASAEQRWIAFFRGNGAALTNGSDGGEGNLGYSPPPEVREKISRANKGCKRSPEHIAKMAAAARLANTGRHRSPEITEKIASQLRGVPRPPEVWENCRKASKGRIVSKETRQKLSDCRRGKPLSLETRARMSESAKHKPPMSAETRALLSAKLKGRTCGTPEGRRSRIEKMRGRINPKAIAAMIAANTGSKHPPETAAKNAATRASWPPEYRAEVGRRISEKCKGRKHSAETREKLAAWHRGRKASPETLIRMSESAKRKSSASNNGLLSLWER
jgi:hypothetical protein